MKIVIRSGKGQGLLWAGICLSDGSTLWAGIGHSRRTARVKAKARARADVPRRLFLK